MKDIELHKESYKPLVDAIIHELAYISAQGDKVST